MSARFLSGRRALGLLLAFALTAAASARAEPPQAISPARPPGAGSSAPAAPGVAEANPRPPPVLEGIEPEPGGLTAAEVARRVLAVSPSVQQKRAEVTVASEKITQTMIQFFPRVTLLASYLRLSPVSSMIGVPPASFTIKQIEDTFSAGARLSIPLSDYVLRLADAAASSAASKEAARLALEAERLKVASDARALYFNWLRARAQAAIAEKAVERTRARLEDARAAFTVGAISRGELLRIEALVANTELVDARARSFVALTMGQLAILMEDPHPAYRVGEGVPDPAAVPEPKGDVTTLAYTAFERRLEVAAVAESAKAFRHGAGATRAGSLPRVDGVGDVTEASPNPRYFPPQKRWNATWSLGVQASWTIDDLFLGSAAARELEANAAAMDARARALRGGIANEVLMAHLDLSRARVAYQKQRVALDAAEEAYRVTTDLFRAGRATGTDLIEAEGGLLDAKLGDVNARIDLTVAAISLRHATGEDRADAPAR